ncbi:Glycoside hydrolase family 16 CRH1 predicted [Penicillium taxi]|uniref:Glycoside hydrolase family 16 CRH1 predicted n=1 Tax=Penicillium taxi TaxID=168475 RepID=UPI0025456A89|nr:Glycoside hydrolase family 16 CRH1 predicted [Penicillium taxi]KAJ5899222.1 Glycoside hydrolase family 16 CRH1 predicted [Penicillium taxi]
MRFAVGATLSLICSSAIVLAQTYTECNPTEKTCPADTALGKSDQKYDFTSGISTDFSSSGNVAYDGTNGMSFKIAQSGDGPLIQSGWYIMFGKLEFTIKAAPGTGIVSSAVLQSDDLDEIDWEWLGGEADQVQTNYFGKGNTSTYDRGANIALTGTQSTFHTYSVDWTSTQIIWAIDGETVRVLTPETADSGQYPQTPMMVKVGAWAGGDSNNTEGTIEWAGGVTDYSKGPFTMYMKSMTATDYSTGTAYSYEGTSGLWTSIKSEGGEINGNSADEPSAVASAPTVTATVDIPIPWSGTHKETDTWTTPDVWPWVSTATRASTTFPAGWESSSNHVQPPGGASLSEHPTTTNTSMYYSTKTDILSLQSTSQSILESYLSSQAASPSSGFEAGLKHTTLHTTSITSQTTITGGDKIENSQEALTATATHSSSTVAPSVEGRMSSIQVPTLFGSLCALLGSIFAMI